MALISVTEYSERTGKDSGNIRRMLAAGRLPGVKIGKQWAIEEDESYPADNRVRSGEYRNWRKRVAFNTNKELAAVVRNMVRELTGIYGQCLKEIILYGSYARGEQTEESDVDIALILAGKHDRSMYDKMINCVAENELKCDKVLSVIDIDAEKYRIWKDVLPFYKNVDREGIVLWKQS